MATTFISPFNRDLSDYDIWNSGHRTDAVDAERYVLRAQDIAEAERMLIVNSRLARPPEDPFTYMTTTADLAVNHPIAEINKRLAQLEDYEQAEFKKMYSHHTALITRVYHLLHQLENQNAAIIELSRIIDELKQDGFQPLEPLEDVD